MERKFGAQHCQSRLLYLDDIIVFSSSIEDRLHYLDVVLSCLGKEELKSKLEKFYFLLNEVQYLATWFPTMVYPQGSGTGPLVQTEVFPCFCGLLQMICGGFLKADSSIQLPRGAVGRN